MLSQSSDADLPVALPLKRKIAAIMAADVAGYSRLVAEDEEATLRALAAARDIFDALIARAGGRIFNTAGDSVMCEFDSAVEAVRVAVEAQARLAGLNAGVPKPRRLEFRIGLTIGDVVERGGDLLGDGVNIAARLEALAPPGGVCVSRSVHEAVVNKIPVPFRDLGTRQVKNIPQPLHVYLIEPAKIPAATPAATADRLARGRVEVAPQRRRGRLAIAAVAAILLVAGSAAYYAGSLTDALAPSRVVSPTPNPQTAGGDETTRPPANEARDPRPAVPTPPKAPPRRTATADAPVAPSGPPGSAAPPETRSLAELYRAARSLEAAGDRAGALKTYASAIARAGDNVDLPLRYAALLTAEGGAASASRTLDGLVRAWPGASGLALAAAATGGPQNRQRDLEAYATARPDDGAAQYLLAQSLRERRSGGPTLTERRLAHEALDRFLDAAADGGLAKRFFDKAMLDGWMKDARTQRAAIEASFASGATRPSAVFRRTSSGWLARLTLPEPATEISTRLGERGEFRPTGPSGALDPTSGQPVPNVEIELPATPGRQTLYVLYRDLSGHAAGPFPIAFDPGAATVETGRETLERYPDSWVSFRPDLPDVLSYASLVSNRCAIRKVEIGFGEAAPSTPLALPPCDPGGPTTMPSGVGSSLTLPSGTEQVQVRLIYADGQESQTRTFRRP